MYNLKLFWRMAAHAVFGPQNEVSKLTPRRMRFLFFFLLLWPPYTLLTWCFFWLDNLLFPGYKQQVVEKPLFIMGNFRSGSTFLHRLLSRDSNTFTSLRTWDIFFMPSVTQRKLLRLFARVDRKIGSPIMNLIHRIDNRSVGKWDIHKVSLLEPEEDENIMLHLWSTFFVVVFFPFLEDMPQYQFFDDVLPAHEKARIMGFYRDCVKRHLYADAGKRHFVAKNPAFSAKIETLREFFPDARIVYLARNPLDTLPSTVSLLTYYWKLFNTPEAKYVHCEDTLALAKYWYHHPLEYMDAHPSPLQIIVRFDDLIGDAESVIRHCAAQFGYPIHPRLTKMVQQAMTDAIAHRSVHNYDYTEMGFTRERIISEFAAIFERFGFDQRGPALQPSLPLVVSDAAD